MTLLKRLKDRFIRSQPKKKTISILTPENISSSDLYSGAKIGDVKIQVMSPIEAKIARHLRRRIDFRMVGFRRPGTFYFRKRVRRHKKA